MIARALIECAKQTNDLSQQQQLNNAAMSIRSGPKGKWSPKEIADAFLDSEMASRFRTKFSNDSAYNTVVEIDQAVYEKSLNFTVYKLESGVVVSSPLSQVGDAVRVRDEADGSHLSCEGRVLSQKIRSPNGVR